jgi:lipoprotein-anchoring transpeptidase ErfK/SrfK
MKPHVYRIVIVAFAHCCSQACIATLYIAMCLAFSILWSCRDERADEAVRLQQRQDSTRQAKRNAAKLRDSANARAVRAANAVVPYIAYTKTVLGTRSRLDSVRTAFGKKSATMLGYRVFTTLNRKDIQFFRVGDTVLLPSIFNGDLRVYSMFPHLYPQADTIPKIILISNKYQCYACYEHGKLVRFAACNTGEERKPTFPGRYTLNWRDKLRRSSLDSSWVLPFTWNFHLFAGSAFHQFAMPGRPVSHSCVRQFMEDAEWLYSWGKGAIIDTATRKYIPMTGAPVIILDVFDFSRKKGGAWWDALSNRDSMIVLPRSPMFSNSTRSTMEFTK